MNALSPQLTTALMVLGVVQLSRQLNLDDPHTINAIRVAYVISQLTSLAIMYYVKTKIEASNNNAIIEVDASTPSFSNPNPTQKKRMTIKEYDLSEWSAQFKQTLIPIALMVGLHIYVGFVQPLIIQSLIPLKALYSTPLVQIYILGKAAEGTLARPWKKPNPFEGIVPTPPQPDQQETITESTAPAASSEPTPTSDGEPTSMSSPETKPKTRKRNVPRDS